MTRRGALMLASAVLSATPRTPVIIDTDVGSDDLLAIAFLLSRADIRIEAITVANGLAHVERGAANLVRLLTLAGKPDIPVYIGRSSPMRGHREFPAAWRRTSDELLGVHLPAAKRKPQSQSAAEFLARTRPVRILALGPLTNLAEAGVAGRKLVIMGGALRVPGNLGDGGFIKTNNTTAEWNIFVDPLAASIVFRSASQITLIPLDATAKVPIDMAFLQDFQKRARTPLGRFAAEVLESYRQSIEDGYFQAWDPLAAVALVEAGVVLTKMAAIEVLHTPPEDGRTVEAKGQKPNVAVAMDAKPAEFKRVFLAVF